MSWKTGLKSGCLEGRQLVFGEKLEAVACSEHWEAIPRGTSLVRFPVCRRSSSTKLWGTGNQGLSLTDTADAIN